MSTQINVTVERGDLVERAKAEQQKNRRQKLEADARRKVAAQARAAREQAQTPIPERLPSVAGRRDELAAQRMLETEVPYYFQKYAENNIYAVASGDASQQASGSFSIGNNFTAWAKQIRPDPITSLLPSGHTLISTSQESAPSGALYYVFTSVKVASETDELLNPPYGVIYNYIRTQVLERAVLYWFPDSGVIENIRFSMPLGKGQACDFSQRRGRTRGSAAMTLQQSTTTRYVQIIDGALWAYGPFISDTLNSFAKTYDQQYTNSAKDSFCFRVSEQSVTAVAPPSGLLSVVDDLLPVAADAQVSVGPATPGVFASPLAEWVDNEFNYIGYTGSIPITGLSETVTDPGYSNYSSYVQSSYAVATPPVPSESAVTPLIWFILDSDSARNQIANSGIAYHPRILNATLSGGSTTVSSVLKGKYLGIEEVSNSYPLVPGSYLYGWGSPSVVPSQTGDPSYGYGYPNYTQTPAQGNLWKARQARIPQSCADYGPGDSASSQSWSKVLIYDWQNPAFCRQQASRYGL